MNVTLMINHSSYCPPRAFVLDGLNGTSSQVCGQNTSVVNTLHIFSINKGFALKTTCFTYQ